MGGSSLPADLFNDLFGEEQGLICHRDYDLPHTVQKKDLIICASFSGNTEETLSSWEQARKNKLARVALTNGGKLAALAKEEKQPLIHIPDCIQPRCATGYFFGSLLGLMHELDILGSHEDTLKKLQDNLLSKQKDLESQGQKLAQNLVDKVPIIYGPTELAGLCRIWKIKFNENSKIQSFANSFPELNHNEMVGYTKLLMPIAIIHLKWSGMDERITKRMRVMGEVLPQEIDQYEIKLTGTDLMNSTFEGVLVGDYCSYHLAQNYGIDPTPVAMVEDFKKRLV